MSENGIYFVYTRRSDVKMITTIQKWGNSQGVRIPKSVLDCVAWNENEEIVLLVEDGKIVMKKAKRERKSIKELFEDFEGEYEPVEVDWGKPVGDEIW